MSVLVCVLWCVTVNCVCSGMCALVCGCVCSKICRCLGGAELYRADLCYAGGDVGYDAPTSHACVQGE